MVRLQNLDERKAVSFSGDISGLAFGIGAAETVKIQRSACLDLEALKAVALPKAGIKGFLHDKAVLTDIAHRNQTVREPSEL